MKRVIAIIFYILCFYNLNAQSILRLRHINVEDGLSQSSVNYIFQDAHGFIWFATGDGLERYDGKEFIAYKGTFQDTLSSHLKGRNINTQVLEDKNNRLWLCTDEGVSYIDYRHSKSEIVKKENGQSVYAMPCGIDSNLLWAVQSQNGTYAINTTDLKYTFYPFADKRQLDRQNLNLIFSVVSTSNALWMVDKSGLLFFNKNTHKDERLLLNDKLYAVFILHDGHLLLTSEDGIYLYDTLRKNTEFIPILNKEPIQWKNFAEDVIGHTLYLGAGNNGIICKMNTETKKYTFIDFQNKNINSLFIDRTQNLWVGTEGNGVYKLDIKQPKFFCYTANDPARFKEANELMVKSIYRDDSGKVWIGTFGNGLIVYDPSTGQQKKIAFPNSTQNRLISTVMKDSSGRMMVTLGGEIFWIALKSRKILNHTSLPLINSVSVVAPIIYSLIEWKKDNYFAGTNDGLYAVKLNDGIATVNKYNAYDRNKYIQVFIYSLHKEKDGFIYLGERDGMARIQIKGDTISQDIEHDFDNIGTRHFYKSSTSGILWMATEKGLVAYNEISKEYKVFDESNGLANSSVYAILAENDTSLWISTNRGLSNLKVHYGNGMNIKVQVVNYTSKDGLQSNEFNTGAFFTCGDGTLIFGGIAGINWFKPAEVVQNPYKAIPVITNMFINDNLYAGDTAIYVKSLRLSYKMNTIGFSFGSLEYTQPEQNQFAYKLEGLDKDWVYTANDKVRYSNLAAGNYTFLLKVSNNEGVWNDVPLKIPIVILPPYWQTWWFIGLAILSSILILILVVRFYVKQKISIKTKELEKKQALYLERLRISKDVHDDLGSGLSKISLIAEIAQKKVSGNMQLGNDIRNISVVSKELVDNMRDLIWVLNPENTSLEQLVSRLREYCADYLECLPIKVILDFPDTVPVLRISREAQRNIFLTVKEAINNCIKHADASQINISLNIDGDVMNINIKDNGKGFDINRLKGSGNGLRNMRNRIETIGGSFEMLSSSNSTEITISITFEKLSNEKNTTLM